jgi:hypothetical protein
MDIFKNVQNGKVRDKVLGKSELTRRCSKCRKNTAKFVSIRNFEKEFREYFFISYNIIYGNRKIAKVASKLSL